MHKFIDVFLIDNVGTVYPDKLIRREFLFYFCHRAYCYQLGLFAGMDIAITPGGFYLK